MPGGRLVLGGGGAIVLLIVALLFGADPESLLRQLPIDAGVADVPASGGAAPAPDDEMAEFVAVVLAETEAVWNAEFERMGVRYEEPRLILFTGQVASACGQASAAVGPFYCPGDRQVYIDLRFYELLKRRFEAPGDFAQAYVIAHEVGHHVQNLLGISEQVQRARSGQSEAEANELSVRLELQADFLAGLWAHHAERAQLLEPGDLEEALRAATAIGDDALQRQSQGYVVPDSFTHGTSEQRVRWFRRGFETGDLAAGDTFAATTL
jgi:predicted metalloprotease